MMLTEVLFSSDVDRSAVGQRSHPKAPYVIAPAANAGTVAATAVISTPGAPGSPNASNIRPAAMQFWSPTPLNSGAP